MFDLSFEKLLVIGVIALFLIGPQRLPAYAAQLARWVRVARGVVDSAKARVKDEMGPEFDDVDWQRLDPRQYNPRRIIRDALLDDAPPAPARTASPRPAAAYEVLDEPAADADADADDRAAASAPSVRD
jgi:sec-independent protein translocase protein TatB